MTGLEASKKTALLFVGQGAQRLGMADSWAGHPMTRRLFDEASEVLGWDLAERSRDPDALAGTEVVQCGLFACGVAAWQVVAAEGLPIDVVAGHSLGEWTGLVAAGVFTFGDALMAVAERAGAMAQAAALNPGTMTAVIGPGAFDLAIDVVRMVAEAGLVLEVANHNSSSQAVLSGATPAIVHAEKLIGERGARAKRLAVAGAFHSSLMAPAAERVANVIDRLEPKPPGPTVIPNATGQPTRDPELIVSALKRQVVAPVLWADTVAEMADLDVGQVLECGPRPVLTGLCRPLLRDASFHWIPDLEAAQRTGAVFPSTHTPDYLEAAL
jgi:[acyl-carrier-protein] S-malonyltransferase